MIVKNYKFESIEESSNTINNRTITIGNIVFSLMILAILIQIALQINPVLLLLNNMIRPINILVVVYAIYSIIALIYLVCIILQIRDNNIIPKRIKKTVNFTYMLTESGLIIKSGSKKNKYKYSEITDIKQCKNNYILSCEGLEFNIPGEKTDLVKALKLNAGLK